MPLIGAQAGAMCLTNLQFMTAGPGHVSLPRTRGARLVDLYALNCSNHDRLSTHECCLSFSISSQSIGLRQLAERLEFAQRRDNLHVFIPSPKIAHSHVGPMG